MWQEIVRRERGRKEEEEGREEGERLSLRGAPEHKHQGITAVTRTRIVPLCREVVSMEGSLQSPSSLNPVPFQGVDVNPPSLRI